MQSQRKMTAWQSFSEEMADVEQKVMSKIEDNRTVLDTASSNQIIHCWHFSFTQDSRNYLAYYMLDTIFGFARHGHEQMSEVLEEPRFLAFLSFVVKEEHDCFLGAQKTVEYFSSLSNRMLRLTNLVDLQKDPEGNYPEVLPDDTIPADPVDDLFEFYGDEEETPEYDRPSLDETLEVLEERVERAKKANENTALLDLTKIEMHKERYVILRRYEKRMEKVSAAVKAVTQQILQSPEDGECQVVTLFRRSIFFIMPAGSKKVVDAFLTLQKALANKYKSQDQADAEACRKCSDFVPLVKEATCMPDSLLSHIDDCCQWYAKQDESEDPETSEKEPEAASPECNTAVVELSTDPEPENKDQEKAEAEKPGEKTRKSKEPKPESKTESKEQSSKQPGVDEASEPKPDTAAKSPEEKEAEGRTAQDGSPDTAEDERSTAKLIKESEYYFTKLTDLEMAFQHSAGRCIFSVQSTGTVDYFCPLLGYLPLLPVLRVLCCAKPEPNGD